ncbi:ThiF family adenylyltransferase [Pseudomonas maumuensis]|uniref:ThiF family adenylyltransferase n=1 Tax=Pseudomonas maumuensis TaxID=2842354 RepID=A0ABX8NM94_9PSED|nr:ThiF family adenylyltransferase [Pseudomonas maumuensis]QXH57136.1 ThiF family adenylyltransferase [Pseudomonas maumuensis]
MDDLIYYCGKVPAGVIAPSTAYAFDGARVLIDGPEGITSADRNDERELRQALQASGALVVGSAQEVGNVIALLSAPQSSRTASYLLCSASQCAQVIGDLRTLSAARIMVVGCGGIGSSLCMLLAGVGVRNFILVDADTIEQSNLNRQFFWTLADIGRSKVTVLKAALEARFESMQIECLCAQPGIADLIALSCGNVDAVAVTADNPPTLARDSWEIAERCNIPVVAGGYLHHRCSAFCFIPDDCAEVESSRKLFEETYAGLPSAIMPSYGPMNVSLAAVLATQMIMALATLTFGLPRTRVDTWDSRGEHGFDC